MMITMMITTMAMGTNIINMAINISMATRRGTSTNINMVRLICAAEKNYNNQT
jgi:hypothetical protein